MRSPGCLGLWRDMKTKLKDTAAPLIIYDMLTYHRPTPQFLHSRQMLQIKKEACTRWKCWQMRAL